MAVTFLWAEDNGAETSDPFKGTTRSWNIGQVNWKNTDDTTTAYSSSPITAGNNSYSKYQFGIFSGTFNQVSAGLWQHVTGHFSNGVTLHTLVTSGYRTPATSTNALLVHNITQIGDISTGLTVWFSTVGPERASGTTTLAATGYSSYLITQLRTTAAAPPGDLVSGITLQLRFSEN